MDEDREAGAMDERVRNLERRIDALDVAIGKIQSDLVNVRTGLVAAHGRQTLVIIVAVSWPVIVAGIALIAVLSVVR